MSFLAEIKEKVEGKELEERFLAEVKSLAENEPHEHAGGPLNADNLLARLNATGEYEVGDNMRELMTVAKASFVNFAPERDGTDAVDVKWACFERLEDLEYAAFVEKLAAFVAKDYKTLRGLQDYARLAVDAGLIKQPANAAELNEFLDDWAEPAEITQKFGFTKKEAASLAKLSRLKLAADCLKDKQSWHASFTVRTRFAEKRLPKTCWAEEEPPHDLPATARLFKADGFTVCLRPSWLLEFETDSQQVTDADVAQAIRLFARIFRVEKAYKGFKEVKW